MLTFNKYSKRSLVTNKTGSCEITSSQSFTYQIQTKRQMSQFMVLNDYVN